MAAQTCLSESTLVKIPLCLKSHVVAHYYDVQMDEMLQMSTQHMYSLRNMKNWYMYVDTPHITNPLLLKYLTGTLNF